MGTFPNPPIVSGTPNDGDVVAFSAALGEWVPVPQGVNQAAVNASVNAAVNALVNGAPGALDTLKELADAINDDASFAATVTAALAAKQPLDADLTAIAALVTTSFGRSLLTQADAAAVRTAIDAQQTGSYETVADFTKKATADTIRGVAARVRAGFDPTKVAGLVGWWSADSLAGADGSAVTSWADRISGITLTQGTGANQPILKTGTNGIGGRNIVRFASSGPQYLQLGTVPVAIPKVGPLTVVVVTKPGPNGAYQRIISYDAASAGWSFGIDNLNTPWFALIGRSDVKSGHTVSSSDAYVLSFQLNVDTTGTFTHNNKYPFETFAAALTTQGTPTTLTIGANSAAATAYNADVAAILIFNRALGETERTALVRYLGAYYGLRVAGAWNAANKLTIPVPGGNDGSVTEPSVIYNSAGVAGTGKKYAMAFVTYDGLLSASELPNFVVSDDGSTWTVPGGLTNPVTPLPGSGHLADSRLRVSPDGSTLMLLYIRQGTGTDGVCLKTSTNGGVSWSAETIIVPVASGSPTPGDSVLEPAPVWDGDRWVMYTINNTVSPQTVEMRTTTDPTMLTGWTSAVRVNVAKATTAFDTTAWWHGDCFYFNGVYYLALSDGNQPQTTPRTIWFAASTDAVNFLLADQPVLAAGFGDTTAQQWDGSAIYRACFQLSDSGRNLLTWYSAFNNSLSSGEHFIGKTSVPVSELP